MFFLEKKHFHRLKSFLHKNGKAQNMPLIACRLVVNSFPILSFLSIISEVLIKSAHFYNMEKKTFTLNAQIERFLSISCQLKMSFVRRL